MLAIHKPNALYDEDRFVRQVEYSSQSGAMSSLRYGNNLRDRFEYDWAGRVSTLRLSEGGYPFVTWYYSYDNAGRLTGIEETKRPNDPTVLQAAFTYAYDRWGMLATAERQYDTGQGYWAVAWSLSHGFDRYGNMLSRQNTAPAGGWTQTYVVDPASNRLQSYTKVANGTPSTVTYGYDAAGNTVTRGSRNFLWDGAGRLKQVWRPSDGSVYGSYRYDPLGRRVKKSWNYVDSSVPRTGSFLYVYGAAGEVVAEYRDEPEGLYGPQASTAYNVYMAATLVARRVTGSLSGNPYARTEWLHRNHLQEVVGTEYSTTSGCPDCSGWSWTYTQPFGSGGSDQFAGHKEDPETGMKHFGARYYHGTSARWVSADRLTARAYDPLSLNKYAYVRNDPVNLTDPDGRIPTFAVTVWGRAYYWEAWWFYDPPSFPFSSAEGGRVTETRAAGSAGGVSGNIGPWTTTWNFDRYDECKKDVTSLGMDPGHVPSLEATRWTVDAYLVTKASPDVLAAIWSVESGYDT